ncbi:MAG: glycosyl transferase [Deltaproteobacteria bacterium]|nr:glycosyl transferase [Deltaproteobacteria bacterium]MBW1924835.1 glycosyl transferase [Deltaproteobacteria bacterium]MBW1950479.1 glycosyl transferase [Deltaproteobacteria bacterium]MBW2008057.1 glycosyl transferase [Deltaproteobacteria bacterium]MBW2102128.1 glycosyl transferase [Deltaproteobacteria bacterium]
MVDRFESEVNPRNVTRAEVVVCIPSYNEADSISYPLTQASKGLAKYFGNKSSVIINCDNNSPDDTKQAFLDTPTDIPKIYLSTPPGVKGKGNNFKNLFAKVVELKPKAVVVVDADLISITPEWIKHLGEPLFNGFSYVAPLYVRHKYDGTITNGIAYPLTRALYGRRVRQPIGGDFGFSGKLARVYLESKFWDEAVANFGIDIWMTTLAICQRVRVCQSFMGRPKIHRTKDPGAHLGPMFRQVVGTIFAMMGHFEAFWTKVKYSRPTAIYGFGLGEDEMPPKVEVDTANLFNKFREGHEECGEIWQKVLSEDVFKKLLEILGMKETEFNFPTDLWARLLFDVAVSYRDEVVDRDRMMDALIPLYFGRTLSFVRRTRRMSIKQAEEAIEEDCETFEAAKPYLLKRWRGT